MKEMKKKFFKKGSLLAIVLILVTTTTLPKLVCAEDSPAIFIYGISQRPESIDCHETYYDPSSIKGQVCEGLFAYDLTHPENAIVPRLADGDGVWIDETTLTVALKENVYFHDGTPFNADAVKWNFDRLLLLTDNPFIEPVLEELIVIDNNHVSFKLFSPYAPFKSLLCSPFAYMMSPSSTPQYRFLDPEHHVLVGTGPYQYISYDGVSIEFEYWPYYYGGTPAIKQMTWNIYENDPYTKNLDLIDEKIHMVDVPDPSLFGEPSPDHILLQQGLPTSGIYYLGMNNIRVDTIFRQAISYAIDYETIITDIRHDQAIRLKSPIPNGILYANDGFGVATLNIPKARTILKDNIPDLPPVDDDGPWIAIARDEPLLTIKYPTIVGHWIDDLAHLVLNNLKLIGIKVDLVEIQGGNYYGYLDSGEADIFFSGWGPDFNDPSNYVNNFFSDISPNNWARVDDELLEQLMDAALTQLNPGVREGLYDQIQEYLVEDLMPFCYLYVNTYDTAWNIRLENYPLNSLQIVWFFDCTWDSESTIPGYDQTHPIEDLKNIEPERNIEEAISSGLEWLVEEQAEDGGWNQDYTNDRVGISAFALLKLEERAFELDDIEGPLDPSYDYYENVMDGLNFILKNAYLMDTDSDAEVDALFFAYNPDENYHHFVYETSVAMLAIAASEQPDKIVAISSSINDWTYEEVLQFALNYLIYAQRDNELYDDGGWGYGAPGQLPEWWGEDRSDNSNTGWAVLALIYAQNRFGLYIPDFVKDNLNVWIDFIQGEDGGSGYGWPNDWENVLKTGNLLFEMALVGDDIESPRVQAAIHYIEEHWNDKNQDPGWLVNYQAMYTLMKGFESMGINTITVNDEKIDWFEDISFIIVESQRYDGSWPSDLYGGPTLTTTWGLLTLERIVEIPIVPVDLKQDAICELEDALILDPDDDDIIEAIDYLHMSLGDERGQELGSEVVWGDPFHIDEHNEGYKGEDVFQYEQEAVDKLIAYIENDENEGTGVESIIYEVMEKLYKADKSLATIAIQDAIEAGGKEDDIEDAQDFLAEADDYWMTGDYYEIADNVYDYLEKAWEKAVGSY